MKHYFIFFALITGLLLSGCAAVGPDYVKPETPVGKQWYTPLAGGLQAQSMEAQNLAVWWRNLEDPELSSLMERAVAENLDVKKARARLREARARRGIVQSRAYPAVDATARGSYSRVDRNDAPATDTHLYAAGLDASWEIDIFGGVRRSVEAADADIGAAGEALNDTLISLLAETALNYVDLRTAQARIASAEVNIRAQMESFDLSRWRVQAGLDDELALQQALSNLESSRAQIPALHTGLNEAMNRLAVLLGRQPGAVHGELVERKPIPVSPLDVAVGVPADVLRQRPDVRRAERELAAQTARIGVAQADYYPRLTFSGSIGLETLSLRNLSTAGSQALSVGPRLSWRIFDAGAVRRNVEVQSAVQEQYLIAYEAAIHSALEEVENRLTAYARGQERRQSLLLAAGAAKEAADLARFKYDAGLVDFRYVLETQRTLLSLQDQLAQSEGAVTADLVRLYKALGGGWTPMVSNENQPE
jgi:NodT family efflux transporter outer membrane factor (OMF) lipoprotein